LVTTSTTHAAAAPLLRLIWQNSSAYPLRGLVLTPDHPCVTVTGKLSAVNLYKSFGV
jgi:hypothetical protein